MKNNSICVEYCSSGYGRRFVTEMSWVQITEQYTRWIISWNKIVMMFENTDNKRNRGWGWPVQKYWWQLWRLSTLKSMDRIPPKLVQDLSKNIIKNVSPETVSYKANNYVSLLSRIQLEWKELEAHNDKPWQTNLTVKWANPPMNVKWVSRYGNNDVSRLIFQWFQCSQRRKARRYNYSFAQWSQCAAETEMRGRERNPIWGLERPLN